MSSHGITRADMAAVNLPRRRVRNRVMEALAWLSALIAVAFLFLIIWSVFRKGVSELNLDLLTKTPQVGFLAEGASGLANAFVGSLVIVGIAALMAMPFGILIAIYLSEFAPRWISNGVSLVLDVLNGIPAIVIGIFVYGLLVLGHGQSALAGSFALAILMLPLVTRATMEVLTLVPNSLREASLGLGVPRWRTVVSIVLPQSVGGIVTGTILAVARAAGETAPLLFTSSLVGTDVNWNPQHALQSVPVAIFELSESPDPADHARAWAAAFVLLMFILVMSMLGRYLATRSRRKISMSR
jgi:phosphate transport system permease protein